MIYLSRRRRRRMRFWGFVLLAVWLLGVAAAHDVTLLVAYAAITLIAITVDLAAGRSRRGRHHLPPRRHRGTATARPPRSGPSPGSAGTAGTHQRPPARDGHLTGLTQKGR
ncbi:hypothetical protein [Protofrankia coriariae]|uniref:hypothetical protein n=1 Tax=Protofrankia coriariae TaxID=1562887 RepID=UPI000A321027|nr:hypothetical protein [Protofrankia coriariae]